MYSLLTFGLVLTSLVQRSSQHGVLLSPPQRGSLWRYGYDTPPNYDDNGLFCGGLEEYINTGGKCGACGDPYNGPREHEAGGKYAKGIIVEQLPAGTREMRTTIQITSYHKGYFEFRICSHNDIRRPVSQQCLDEHLMTIKEGTPESGFTRFYPLNPKETGQDKYEMTLVIPEGMRCQQCVLQWTYNTGNSWGTDKNGTSCLGCGLQEVFKNCADISIGGSQTVQAAEMALLKSQKNERKRKLKHEIKSELLHHVHEAIGNSKLAKIMHKHERKPIKNIPLPTPVFSTKSPSTTSSIPHTTFSAKALLKNRNLFMPVNGISYLSQIQNNLRNKFKWLKQIPFHHTRLLSRKTPDPRFTLSSKIKFMPETTMQEQRTTALAFNPSPKIGLYSYYTTRRVPVPRVYEVKYNYLPKNTFNLYANPSVSLLSSGGNPRRVSVPAVPPTAATITYARSSPITTTRRVVTTRPSSTTTEAPKATTVDPLDISQWGKETVTRLPKKYQNYYKKYKAAKSTFDLFKRKPEQVLNMSKYRRYKKRRNGQRRLHRTLSREVKRLISRLEKAGKRHLRS